MVSRWCWSEVSAIRLRSIVKCMSKWWKWMNLRSKSPKPMRTLHAMRRTTCILLLLFVVLWRISHLFQGMLILIVKGGKCVGGCPSVTQNLELGISCVAMCTFHFLTLTVSLPLSSPSDEFPSGSPTDWLFYDDDDDDDADDDDADDDDADDDDDDVVALAGGTIEGTKTPWCSLFKVEGQVKHAGRCNAVSQRIWTFWTMTNSDPLKNRIAPTSFLSFFSKKAKFARWGVPNWATRLGESVVVRQPKSKPSSHQHHQTDRRSMKILVKKAGTNVDPN